MKFARIGPPSSEVPVAEIDDQWWDLRAITSDVDGAFLSDRPVDRTREAHAARTLGAADVPVGTRWGAPIARPGAVICVGMNYAAHAAESGSEPPTAPVIFLKTPNTVGGPDDAVVIPRGSRRTDWEVELGVVIGQRTAYLDSPADSSDRIAGFVAVNDVSERTFQLDESGGQWSKGKCAYGFTPVGPWLVSPEEVDAGRLRLRSFVNGQPTQDSNTADMIFPVDEIIWHLSQYLTLEPGDLVLTGTPEGVALSGRFPYLKDGDEVDIDVHGLGRQRQTFVAWSAAR